MALRDFENNQFNFTEQDRKDYSSGKLGQIAQQQMYGHLNEPSDVEPERTLGGTLADVGISLGKGVTGLGQAAVGLANIPTLGYAGKGLEKIGVDLEATQDYLSSKYSPAQQKAFKEVDAADGFWNTVGESLENPSTIIHGIIESAPSMAGGGLIGRGILKALPKVGGLVAGAIGEGAVTAGQIAEDVRQQNEDKLLTGKQVAQAVGAGLGTGAIGMIGGKIAKSLNIGDVDTMLATGKFAEKSNKGVMRRIVEGGISEGVFEELPQSMQEQVWTNAALGRDLGEDVGKAGATGLLAGALMGGGVNIISHKEIANNFNDEEKQNLSDEHTNIITAEQAVTTPEEQTNIQQMKEDYVDTVLQRKQENELAKGIAKTEEELRVDRQELYNQFWELPINKSAEESAQAILTQKPFTDIEQSRRDTQKQINKTYLPAEEEVDRINAYRLRESQINDEPTPVALRTTDLITRDGKPYQKKEFLEGLLSERKDKDDYEIMEVPGGFVARLTDKALDPRRERYFWEDETGKYPSEASYWQAQQEALIQQQSDAAQRPYNRSIGPITRDQQFRQEQQKVISQTLSDTELGPIQQKDESLVDSADIKKPFTNEQPVVTEQNLEEQPNQKPIENIEDIQTLEEPTNVELTPEQVELNNLDTRLNEIEQQLEVETNALTKSKLKVEKNQKKYLRSLQQKIVDEQKTGIDQKLEVRENLNQLQKIDLPQIQKMFKNQEVFQDENGSLNVKLKNGRGINIQSIQDAGNGYIQLAINTGQMSKNGKILGVTTGSNILLDKDFADKATVWHETKHVFDNLGMLNQSDNSALTNEFNKLRKTNKLNFSLSTHEDPMIAMEENLANTFAQVMTSREAYRNKPLGTMIQRIMDFMKNLFSMGQQTVSKLAKEVESGKIYEREALGQTQDNVQFKEAGNTNSEEFKSWFGKSVAKTHEGEPVSFYHGTPNNFTVFEDKKLGESTKHTASGLGHFFSMDKNYANTYSNDGNIIEAYLKMEKPYKMSLEEAQNFDTVTDAIVRKRQLKLKGYDSVIIPVPGAAPMIAIFNSNQIKSVMNQGTWDINNPDIRFQVEDLSIPEQKITQKEYHEVYTQKNNLLQDIMQQTRMAGSEVKLLIDKIGGSISTRLSNIDPKLGNEMRQLDYRTQQKIVNQLKIALPILSKTKKMSSQDKSDWDWARKNSDTGKINQLANKYGFAEDYMKLREELNQIRQDADDVGYEIGFLDEYWPRVLRDREGFLRETQDISKDPIFTQAIKKQADKIGVHPDKLDPNIRADIISNIILGRGYGISGTGNMQARVFDQIDPKYNKYYLNSDEALMQYIYSMNKKIEARRFFGKVPAKIQEIKRRKNLANATISKYEGLDPVVYKEMTDPLKADIIRYDQELEKYKHQRNFTENIGSYIDELVLNEKDPEKQKKLKSKEQELRDILDARFHEKGTHGIVNKYKNIAYIDTMGNPLSAITQIGDLAWAYYIGGLNPKGIATTTKNLINAILKKSNIRKEDLGFERISQEFAEADSFSRAVNRVFKVTGLERMDAIGKETLINTSLDNYVRKAKSDPNKLKKELQPILGRETDSTVNALLTDNPGLNENVKYLVYSRVLDFHPAALSEMPEWYLKSGNGRIMYMLKTYTLKQIDVFRNEVWHNFKQGDQDGIIKGMRNMVSMGALLTLANAGADEIKDFLMGKEVRFEDHVIENLLTLGGASRFMKTQIRNEGIGSSIGQQLLPPFKFIDSISKDITGNTSDGFRSVDSIPVAGKLYYWHYGRGNANKKSIAQQDFDKLKNETNKFKKKLDDTSIQDKRLFIQSNLEDFKRFRQVSEFQSNLNQKTSLIGKLKKMEQTPNVRKRIGQLEQQKESMLEKYMNIINERSN